MSQIKKGDTLYHDEGSDKIATYRVTSVGRKHFVLDNGAKADLDRIGVTYFLDVSELVNKQAARIQYERLRWNLRTLEYTNHGLWMNRAERLSAIQESLKDLLTEILPYQYAAGDTVRVKTYTYGKDVLMLRLDGMPLMAGTQLKVLRVDGHYHVNVEILYVETPRGEFCYIESSQIEKVSDDSR